MIRKLIFLVGSLFNGKVIFDYRMIGLHRKRWFKIPSYTNYIRINNFELIANEIHELQIEGNVAELGVYKGEFAKYINMAFPEKTLYLFDTFEGFNNKDIEVERSHNYSLGNQNFADTSADVVLEKMPHKRNCIIKKGYFPDSLDGLEDRFCFVSLDADLYKPILDGLEYFYPRLNKGGYILVHDYNNELYAGAKQAVREFCSRNNLSYVPLTDSWGTAVISK